MFLCGGIGRDLFLDRCGEEDFFGFVDVLDDDGAFVTDGFAVAVGFDFEDGGTVGDGEWTCVDGVGVVDVGILKVVVHGEVVYFSTELDDLAIVFFGEFDEGPVDRAGVVE